MSQGVHESFVDGETLPAFVPFLDVSTPHLSEFLYSQAVMYILFQVDRSWHRTP
jgi:hypothetical protein